MRRQSQPPLLKRISSLFNSNAKTSAEPDIDCEIINKCTRTLVDDHHLANTDAANLVRGLSEMDLYIFSHLLTNGVTPAVARKKIDDNDLDVIELRTIESPSQRMGI